MVQSVSQDTENKDQLANPDQADNKKVQKSFQNGHGSLDYYNDPLYIRFQEYKLLKKRTRQIELHKCW